MTRRAQNRVDGLAIDKHMGRFAGSFDLEDDELEHAGLDETVVAVVVSRVREAKTVANDKGELEETRAFRVSDMRILQGDLRTSVIEQCGLMGTDTAQLPLMDENLRSTPPADRARIIEPEPDVEYASEPVFDGQRLIGTPSQTETVGSVYGENGRADQALRDFMDV